MYLWTSLDTYCTQNDIRDVAMIKIDVEGYEGEVLKGAGKVLEYKPHINLELHLDDLKNFGLDSGECTFLASHQR